MYFRSVYLYLFLAGLLLTGSCRAASVAEGQQSLDEEMERAMKGMTQTIVIVRNNYIEPVTLKTLVDGAVSGMLMLAGEPPAAANATNKEDENSFAQLQRVSDVLHYLQGRHPQLSTNELINAATEQMVKLDKQSRFATADDYVTNIGVIGVEIGKNDESIVVVGVMQDSPALQGGIRRGDLLDEIDGHDVKGVELNDVVKLLRGKPGSITTIKTIRSDQTSCVLQIKRVTMKYPDLVCPAVRDGIGYIHMRHFTQASAANLTNALSMLENEHGLLSGLVLDLRDNRGGLLSSAVSVADIFLEKGLIFTTEGRTADSSLSFNVSEASKPYGKLPMVVLVNEQTSAGAEAVAAALQDHRRAIIIGSHSAGSGMIRTVYDIGGRRLMLTTARLVRPSGQPIDLGVEPDQLVDGNPDLAALEPWQPCQEVSVQKESAEIAFAVTLLAQTKH